MNTLKFSYVCLISIVILAVVLEEWNLPFVFPSFPPSSFHLFLCVVCNIRQFGNCLPVPGLWDALLDGFAFATDGTPWVHCIWRIFYLFSRGFLTSRGWYELVLHICSRAKTWIFPFALVTPMHSPGLLCVAFLFSYLPKGSPLYLLASCWWFTSSFFPMHRLEAMSLVSWPHNHLNL